MTWTVGQVFYLEQCSAGEACLVAQIAIHESHRAGNRIERRERDNS